MHYVVIPTYQERENIATTVSTVLGLSPDFRAVVVDDASTDGTSERLDELSQEFPDRLQVIHRKPPRSFAGSYIDGFRFALSQPDCESVIECDADGSHPFPTILDLTTGLQESDVMIGSRYVEGGNIGGFSKDRLLLSSTANAYLRHVTGLRVQDITAGFVGYRADFLRCLPFETITSNGYAFQIEMKWLCAKANARMREIPITFIDRSHGQSKMNLHTMIEAFTFGLRYGFKRIFG
jgi:dolichol-phosphate mannosyltransferase